MHDQLCGLYFQSISPSNLTERWSRGTKEGDKILTEGRGGGGLSRRLRVRRTLLCDITGKAGQPEKLVQLQLAPAAAPTTSEEEQEETEEQEYFPYLEQEEEEEVEDDDPEILQDPSIFVVRDEPAVISVERKEAPEPIGVQPATPRCDILRTSGQRGEQSPTLEGQTECLISMCRETVTIGRELIQRFHQFSNRLSQFSMTFSNWSVMQTELARDTLEGIRELTAATNALRHVLLAGHGTAPQGVVLVQSGTPSTQVSMVDTVPLDSEDERHDSPSTPTLPPWQEVLPLPTTR
uniref:uncharacterized protein isoform X3 n=1 Tax=Pristiophorus japonicus TaxID=55135 RepID=UPI00398E890F